MHQCNRGLCDYSSPNMSHINRHINKVHAESENSTPTSSRTSDYRKRKRLFDSLSESDKEYVSKKLKTDTPKVGKAAIDKLMSDTSLSNREILKCLQMLQ